jgi:hypothetical protein
MEHCPTETPIGAVTLSDMEALEKNVRGHSSKPIPRRARLRKRDSPMTATDTRK